MAVRPDSGRLALAALAALQVAAHQAPPDRLLDHSHCRWVKEGQEECLGAARGAMVAPVCRSLAGPAAAAAEEEEVVVSAALVAPVTPVWMVPQAQLVMLVQVQPLAEVSGIAGQVKMGWQVMPVQEQWLVIPALTER